MQAPEEIHGVSQGQFSIARYYGGCTFRGAAYTYDAERDVLVRNDILKARRAKNKAQARAEAAAERKRWAGLQEGLEL